MITILRVAASVLPLLAWSWLSCMLIHELGHVLGAWATGGRLVLVDVRPWVFSTTLVDPNPRPSVVLWAGFLLGWLVPFATIPFWRTKIGPVGAIAKAWSAYCWLSMGSYLALAMGERFSDTGLLLKLGWSPIILAGVGIVVAAGGYWIGKQAIEELAVLVKRNGVSIRAISCAWGLLGGWWLGQYSLAVAFEVRLGSL